MKKIYKSKLYSSSTSLRYALHLSDDSRISIPNFFGGAEWSLDVSRNSAQVEIFIASDNFRHIHTILY